jgi:hypothetical protein
MALERREISLGDTPRIGWLWGLLLIPAVVVFSLAAVAFFGLAVTVVLLYYR